MAFDDMKPIYCTYVTPNLQCHNVGQLIPLVTYFISVKAYYAAPTVVNSFSAITIILMSTTEL